jgi:hypothetical protein
MKMFYELGFRECMEEEVMDAAMVETKRLTGWWG